MIIIIIFERAQTSCTVIGRCPVPVDRRHKGCTSAQRTTSSHRRTRSHTTRRVAGKPVEWFYLIKSSSVRLVHVFYFIIYNSAVYDRLKIRRYLSVECAAVVGLACKTTRPTTRPTKRLSGELWHTRRVATGAARTRHFHIVFRLKNFKKILEKRNTISPQNNIRVRSVFLLHPKTNFTISVWLQV